MKDKDEQSGSLIASTIPYTLYTKLKEEADKKSVSANRMARLIIKEFIENSSNHTILQRPSKEPNVAISITKVDLSIQEALIKIAAETDNSKSYVVHKIIEEYFKDMESGEQ